MTHGPDVSVIVVSYQTRALLAECLDTLARTSDGVAVETIVVDNASRDGSAAMVAERFPDVRLLASPVNLGFAAANNRALALARGRHVALLNPDALLAPGALGRALALLETQADVGVGGARLVGRDGSWQPSARRFPSPLNDALTLSGLAARHPRSRFFGRVDRTWADPDAPCDADWVPGAFSLIRRALLERIGVFDERFFLYYEEVDLCRRAREARWRVAYWPDVVVAHVGGESARSVQGEAFSSSGSQLTLWRMRSALLYHRKHHGAHGAWSARLLETAWHTLRARRHAGHDDPVHRAKAQESKTVVRLMQRAWADTRGGRVSPPRPW